MEGSISTEQFKENIDDFSIDEIIIDNNDGAECKVTGKTSNSIEVYIPKKKSAGVNCKNWFDMRGFNKRFKKKEKVL